MTDIIEHVLTQYGVLPAVALFILLTVMVGLTPVLVERFKRLPERFSRWAEPAAAPLPAWASHADRDWRQATEAADTEAWSGFIHGAEALLDALGERDLSEVGERERARLRMRVAAAMLHLGRLDEGRELLESLKDVRWPGVATWVYSNLAAAENAREEYKAGLALAREAILRDPTNPFGHLNALAAASMLGDRPACEELAIAFARHHPDVRDPSSHLGRIVRADPELEDFRASGELDRRFGRRSATLHRVVGALSVLGCVLLMASGVGG